MVWCTHNLSMLQYGRTESVEGGGMVKRGFVPMALRRAIIQNCLLFADSLAEFEITLRVVCGAYCPYKILLGADH